MRRRFSLGWARFISSAWLAIVAWLAAGCHSKGDSRAPATPAAPASERNAAASAASAATAEALAAARGSLNAGQMDEAAAQLAKLRLQRAPFDAQQAKQFRQELSDAYDRAIEAAQRGDPKGKAALELLRAAAPH